MASQEMKAQAADVAASALEKGKPAVVNSDGADEVERETKEGLKKEEELPQASFAHFLRIFSYGKTTDFLFMATGAVAAIGAGVTFPLMNVIFGNTIKNFSASANVNSSITPNSLMASTNRNSLYMVYLFIAKLVLVYVMMYSFRRVGTRLSAAIRFDYLKALFAQSVSELDKLPSGEAAQTITGGANVLQIGITDKLGTLLQFSALIIGSFVVAFIYSWRLTLVTSSAMLVIIVVFCVVIPIWIKMQKTVDFANGQATSIASETIGAIRMVIACGAESRMAQRHGKWIAEARRRGLKQSPLLGVQLGPLFFVMFADYALSFWYGVKLYQQNRIDNVGNVLIVLISIMLAVMSLGSVIGPLNAATKSAAAAADFFDMIDRPIMPRHGLKEPDVSAVEDIVFEGVTFAYPTRPHVKVMDNFSATFEKGKLTAIVGPSGSGKSTVVGLIERWYQLEPETGGRVVPKKASDNLEPATDEENVALAGTIRIGETQLKDVDMKWWRSQIGLVQQEPFIFNDTILANVAYGLVGTEWENADESITRAKVKEACEEAFADEFISRLPLGYDTQVGESGMKLSGGQRQRLAIARAIVKRPKILIFDEATSSIDVRGERIVQAALDRVAKDRTAITIAHRLSTIRKADKIIVVYKGRLVEQGSHDELVAINDGVYRNLVNAQQIMMGSDNKERGIEEEAMGIMNEKEDFETMEQNTVDEVPYKRKDIIRSFGKLLIENRKYLHWLALTVIGSVGGGAAVPVMAVLMANLITVFSDFLKGTQAMTDASERWSLAFVYLSIGVGISYFLVGWASNTLSVNISTTYRQQYYEGIVQKPVRFFDKDENSTGSLVSRISTDTTQLQELMGTNMGFVYIAMISLTSCVILGLVIGWKLALVALVAALPLTFTAGYYRLRYEIKFEKMNAAVFAESSKFASEAFGAVRTVTSLTLEDMILLRYEKLLKAHVDESEKKSRYRTIIFALSDSVNLLCMALTFWYGGKLLAAGEYNLKRWFIIYTAIIQGSEAAGNWMSFAPNMAQAAAASNRILSLREIKAKKVGKVIETSGGVDIEFKDVQYMYPSRDLPIFSSLNIHIKKGQFAALVGPSGCGKSTIISLLEQFYPVTNGAITFDGHDITDLDVKEYRRLISLVAQEATLFQGTIRENILLGVESATDAEMEKACRDAEIHDFIVSLPDGYGTDIGSKGVALSGGQKQRISIARALIRDPQVLLLDEATSSLDSESEKLIQSAFERAGKGRTMVVVAHRLATVQNADVIFVLGGSGAGGARVLEQGSHVELLERRGVYYQMCQSQALDR